MVLQVRGVRYRKWKTPNGRYVGRVHLQYYDRLNKAWRFVCGKRDDWGVPGDTVDDEIPVTCLSCTKHAPDVVERMDTIPNLEDFQ